MYICYICVYVIFVYMLYLLSHKRTSRQVYVYPVTVAGIFAQKTSPIKIGKETIMFVTGKPHQPSLKFADRA